MIVEEVCSSYSFHQAPMSHSWERAKHLCRSAYSDLVSMESSDEREYLKNITKKKKGRWHIGLKYSSSKWCWLSSTSNCINKTFSSPGNWRWIRQEPNNIGRENCVEMFANGWYNNIRCSHSYRETGVFDGGYICERKAGKKQCSIYIYVSYYVCPSVVVI